RNVRVRVRLGHATVSGPTGVADAEDAGETFFGDARFHFGYAADAAHALDIAFSTRAVVDDGDTGGIIAAVFETFQPFGENGNDIAIGDGADDAAHKNLLGSRY